MKIKYNLNLLTAADLMNIASRIDNIDTIELVRVKLLGWTSNLLLFIKVK
ncbi:MAG: hypothetical protein LBO69_08650 [Ignavibacteria bacterium]|nr:hypothetical protein [Ignavibacteria bacterium]